MATFQHTPQVAAAAPLDHQVHALISDMAANLDKVIRQAVEASVGPLPRGVSALELLLLGRCTRETVAGGAAERYFVHGELVLEIQTLEHDEVVQRYDQNACHLHSGFRYRIFSPKL